MNALITVFLVAIVTLPLPLTVSMETRKTMAKENAARVTQVKGKET